MAELSLEEFASGGRREIPLNEFVGGRTPLPNTMSGESGPWGIPSIPRPVQIGGSAFVRGVTQGLGAAGDLYDWLDNVVAERTMPMLRDATQRGLNAVRRAVGQPEQLMPPRPNAEDVAASGPISNPVQPPTMVPDGVPRWLMRPLGMPSSGELQRPLQAAGIINNPSLAPQTPGEHYIDRIGEVAGASIPFGLRGIVSGAFSGAGDEAARQAGFGPVVRFGASLASGMFGNAAYSIGERLANLATGNLNQVGQAYREAGMSPRMVGDVSGSPMAQRLQLAAGGMPGGTGRATAAAEATVNDFAQAIDRAAANLGNARTAEQAGEALQTGARGWMQRWRTASGEAWDRVLQVLPADRPIPVDNLRQTVNAVGQRMNDVPEVANILRSDRFAALRDAINRSPAEWRSESVRTMRTIIGQLNEAKGLVGDMFAGELDQLYGALSQDIRSAVAMRPGGLAAWEAANAVTSQGHRLVDRVINPMIREGATPSDAFRFATSQINSRTGGGARIGEVANATRAGGEVASALMSQAGQRVMESRSPGAFSQLTDARSARGLAPEAVDVLFGQAGGRDRRVLDALDTIARSSRATQQFANTSRTAGTSALMNYLMGTLPASAAAAGGMLSGHVPPAVGLPAIGLALGAPAAGWSTAYAMTNPLLARYLTAQSSAPSLSQALMNQMLQQGLARQPALLGAR